MQAEAMNNPTANPLTDPWGSPERLLFVRRLAEGAAPGEVMPIRCEFLLWLLDRLAHETAVHPDTERLDFVAAEYMHLIPFDRPTGGGDADVGWMVLQSTQANGDVEIARVYEDNVRAAIDGAMSPTPTTTADQAGP
jgi:hypothetical protein